MSGFCDVQLVEVFGQTRDDWMKEDMEDWLNRNPIYESLPEILQRAIGNDETYIVTTKQVAILTNLLLKGRVCLVMTIPMFHDLSVLLSFLCV